MCCGGLLHSSAKQPRVPQMEQSYANRWEIIRELGAGGQGKVSLVRDGTKALSENDLAGLAGEAFAHLSNTVNAAARRPKGLRKFKELLQSLQKAESPDCLGALKTLHDPSAARDSELAIPRMRAEINAMTAVSHANLLRIIDHSADQFWYVSEYHPRGTLSDYAFDWDMATILKLFAGIVSGVATLHPKVVHRDIKPENIFVSANDRLVLGDFGIVFFDDPGHTRLSRTFENVGSRDWMPPWAMTMRLEEVKPTFDVFSLGKVLWAMFSQQPKLPLWYFRKEQFNLEKLFPDEPRMSLVNDLLSKCIVDSASFLL